MMTDPIADMLTRIRNGALVRKREVVVPFSKIKQALAAILQREGYLARVEVARLNQPTLVLTLQYQEGHPAVQHLERVSKPGHRRYVKKDQVEWVQNGLGIGILSTPRGLLTDREARQAGLGGEYLCRVY